MEINRNDIRELIELKTTLEILLDKGNKDEIKVAYDNFRNLYKKITGKEFEEGLESEKVDQINCVINGILPQVPEILEDTKEIEI